MIGVGKEAGTVGQVENSDGKIGEKIVTPIVGIDEIRVAKSDARRVVGEIFRLVGRVVLSRYARQLNVLTQLSRLF